MRLSDKIKATRLHRLYQVVFWLLIIVSILVAAFSLWADERSARRFQAYFGDALAKNYSFDVLMMGWHDRAREGGAYSTIISISVLLIVFALLLPLLYRLVLYILHGKAAFR